MIGSPKLVLPDQCRPTGPRRVTRPALW